MSTPYIFDPRVRRLAGLGPLNYEPAQEGLVADLGAEPALDEAASPVTLRGIFPSPSMTMMGEGGDREPMPTPAPPPGDMPPSPAASSAPAMRLPGAGLTGDDFTRAIQEATRSGAAARQARGGGEDVPVARSSSGAPRASAASIDQARASRVPASRPVATGTPGVDRFGDSDLARMREEGPSRGGFYAAKEDDVAYLPESVYEEAGKRAELAGQRRAIMETAPSTIYPGLTKGDERGLQIEREKGKISQGNVRATREEFGTALRKEQQDFSEAVARIQESPLEESEKAARLSQAKELYQQAVSELALQFGMARPRVDIGSGYY